MITILILRSYIILYLFPLCKCWGIRRYTNASALYEATPRSSVPHVPHATSRAWPGPLKQYDDACSMLMFAHVATYRLLSHRVFVLRPRHGRLLSHRALRPADHGMGVLGEHRRIQLAQRLQYVEHSSNTKRLLLARREIYILVFNP